MKKGLTCPSCGSFQKMRLLPKGRCDLYFPIKFSCDQCDIPLRFKQLYDLKFFVIILLASCAIFATGFLVALFVTLPIVNWLNISVQTAIILESIFILLPIATVLAIAFILFVINAYEVEIIQQK